MKKCLILLVISFGFSKMFCQINSNSDTTMLLVVEKMPVFSKKCFDLKREDDKYNCTQKAIKEYIGLFNPHLFSNKCLEGNIYISFVIDIDGSVIDVILRRGIEDKIDNEAIEHIKKMPTFYKPGLQRGIPVQVRYTVPISLK